MLKTKTKALGIDQKGKEFNAFNIVFVVELAAHKFIEVPALYCGLSVSSRVRKMLQQRKTVSRHFHQEDKICPKNHKKILFLGPKVSKGMQITYPEPFSDARHLSLGEKYPVAEIRLLHMAH